MNQQIRQPINFPPEPRQPFPEALTAAARLATRLTREGIQIHSAFDNGRRMVLLIEKAPFGVRGLFKGKHPNGMGGTTERYGASVDGCQLEWTVDLPAREVANA